MHGHRNLKHERSLWVGCRTFVILKLVVEVGFEGVNGLLCGLRCRTVCGVTNESPVLGRSETAAK